MPDKTELEIVETPQIIETFGSRDDVREIAQRLMAMHPAAAEVGAAGMRAVAQLAVLVGANPLETTGEIYVWVDKRGRVVVDLGIAYYRRKAQEIDSVVWAPKGEPRPMSQEEREIYGVNETALAGIAAGYRMSSYERLLAASVPWQEASKMLQRTSWAVVEQAETTGKKLAPHGRTWQWVAAKRAEKGLYRALGLVGASASGMASQVMQALDSPYVLAANVRPQREEQPAVSGEEIEEWFSYS